MTTDHLHQVQLLKAQNAKAQAARLRFGDSAVDAPLPLLAPPPPPTSTNEDGLENINGRGIGAAFGGKEGATTTGEGDAGFGTSDDG